MDTAINKHSAFVAIQTNTVFENDLYWFPNFTVT